MDNDAFDRCFAERERLERHLCEIDRILFPAGEAPGPEERLAKLAAWHKLVGAVPVPVDLSTLGITHEVRLTVIPFENRSRTAVYLRRRFGLSLQDSQRAVNSPGVVLQKGLLRAEVDELLPDLDTLGVSYEVVPALT